MQKLYCYVDESGQDTKGEIFLVSVVVTRSEQDRLRELLRNAERTSRKGIKKWKKSTHAERRAYLKLVVSYLQFKDSIFFAEYRGGSTRYTELTIFTIAKAVRQRCVSKDCSVNVFVDGLKRTERFRFGAGLKQLNVPVGKVRGLRDESDEFIRLADAIAGFIRDCFAGNDELRTLYETAIKSSIVTKI